MYKFTSVEICYVLSATLYRALQTFFRNQIAANLRVITEYLQNWDYKIEAVSKNCNSDDMCRNFHKGLRDDKEYNLDNTERSRVLWR